MQTALMLIAMFTICCFSKAILSSLLKYDPVDKENYSIAYPIEPMSENYFDIKECISTAENANDMKRAYVRIIIFQGCYPDGAMFLSELWEVYTEKEINLKIIS